MGAPHDGYRHFDTASLPAEQRFAAWAATAPSHSMSTPDPLAFFGSVSAWHVTPFRVADRHFAPMRYLRTQAHIEADGGDEITAQLILSGHGVIATPERIAAFLPGDMPVQDASRPLDAVTATCRAITLSAPRSFFETELPADVHGLVLRGPEFGLLRAFIQALPDALRQEDGMAPADTARLARDLLTAAMRQAAAEAAPRPATLRMRVKRHIADNLTAPLEADSICAALGVSRSSLYRAMQREGGVAAAVQRQRLARIHWLLSDPAELRSIAALAALHGFRDRSHFSRAFRRAYGESPQDVRAGAGAPRPQPPSGSPQEDITRWGHAARAPGEKREK